MPNAQHPPVIFHRRFTRPRFKVYKVADPARFKAVWNRYDTATIGAAVVVGRRCYSLVWAKPVAERCAR